MSSVEEMYTPKSDSTSLTFLWNYSIFFMYSTSKIYSIGLLLSCSFLLALRVILNELDMSICFPSTVPNRAPITRSVLLVSGSFLWEWSNKFGKICGYMRTCYYLAVQLHMPKFKLASILLGLLISILYWREIWLL